MAGSPNTIPPGPVLLCCQGERQGPVSSRLQPVKAGPAHPLSWAQSVLSNLAGGRGSWEHIILSPLVPHGRTVARSALSCSQPGGRLTCTPASRIRYDVHSSKDQDPLFRVLQLVRGKAISLKLITLCGGMSPLHPSHPRAGECQVNSPTFTPNNYACTLTTMLKV